MAKQRGHGEGSILLRTDGRWAAYITLENRKRKYFYGKTRKEVQEKLKVALYEQKQGTLITAPQQTVTQFLCSHPIPCQIDRHFLRSTRS